MWIELTKHRNNDKILLNLDNFMLIKANWYDQQEGSILHASDGTSMIVKETREEIKAVIESVSK